MRTRRLLALTVAACGLVPAAAPRAAWAAEPLPAAELVPAVPLPPLDPPAGPAGGAGPEEGAAHAAPASAAVRAAPIEPAAVAGAPGCSPAEPEGPGGCGEPEAAVTPPSMPPERLTPAQAQTLAFQMRSYLRQVHERVGRVWAAPVRASAAARRVALVTVVIARDGTVLEARVDRPSKDEGFDRSALRALKRPFLFPPLPPYYQDEALEVGLRFADPRHPARRR